MLHRLIRVPDDRIAPDLSAPAAVLVGRVWSAAEDGSLTCLDLLAHAQHEPAPGGGFWHPSIHLPPEEMESRVVQGAAHVARSLLPRYSGCIAPGDPLHVQEEADGLAGHPAWLVTPDHEPGCPSFRRLGVCQIVGWLRPHGQDDLEYYLVLAVTALRGVDGIEFAQPGYLSMVSGLAVLPIPVGERF